MTHNASLLHTAKPIVLHLISNLDARKEGVCTQSTATHCSSYSSSHVPSDVNTRVPAIVSSSWHSQSSPLLQHPVFSLRMIIAQMWSNIYNRIYYTVSSASINNTIYNASPTVPENWEISSYRPTTFQRTCVASRLVSI